MGGRGFFALFVITALIVLLEGFFLGVNAVEVAGLDLTRPWNVGAIEIEGNIAFSGKTLKKVFQTKSKNKYLPFKHPPAFDPVVFLADLEQLKLFYETHGYYDVHIRYDLAPEPEKRRVNPLIVLEEGLPVRISRISIDIAGQKRQVSPGQARVQAEELRPLLQISEGEPFDQQKYRETEASLRRWFLEKGHARVRIERRADVYLRDKCAIVQYSIVPGPVCFFGHTRIQGLKRVEEEVVRKEIVYHEGERFALSKLRRTRQRLLDLRLFQMVRLEPDSKQAIPEEAVDLGLKVIERPPRDLRLSLGYSTEEGIKTQVGWEHVNFFGSARNASLTAEYSSLVRKFSGRLLNPHFPFFRSRAILEFSQYDNDEDTYMLYATRIAPRIEHDFPYHLTGILGYRAEYARHTDVNPLTGAAIGGLDRKGIISGPSIGVRFDTTDDPLDPKKGGVVGLYLDSSLGPLGGEYTYYRMLLEGRHYQGIGFRTTLATRLKVGLADPIGSIEHYPLFERFYAGGQSSVRGFERRRLGPIGQANDPLGGLSLVEGSVELRRPIFDGISGATFLDFGQVSMKRFDPPFNGLKLAAGVGMSYKSPIGPVRLDLGIPFDAPDGDRGWQVYFGIGHMF